MVRRCGGNPGAPEGMDPRDKPEDDAMRAEATRNLSVMDFVPRARAFQATEMAWRETIGRVYYEFKGFL